MEVVLSSGELVQVNKNENSDLFWALRGACSSSFGTIVSITFRLYRLADSNKLTTISIPNIKFSKYDTTGIKKAMLWWQTWASAIAPSEITSTLSFRSRSISIRMLYAGSLDKALAVILPDMLTGLTGVLSSEEIRSGFHEVDYLGALSWMGAGDSKEELLDLISLKPVSERSTRRISKSSLVKQPLSEDQIDVLMKHWFQKNLKKMQWKAYGGRGVPLASQLYTSKTSPLLKGHIFEMHYGTVYKFQGGYDKLSKRKEKKLDSTVAKIIKRTEEVASEISQWNNIGGESAYIGYIDATLSSPGNAYFGLKNTQRLNQIRSKYDPNDILITRVSEYLYEI
jgi:hypothetical protein